MKIKLCTLFICVFFVSCFNQVNERYKDVDSKSLIKDLDISDIDTSSLEIIKISKDDEHILKTSELFDSVEYIPLSNNPDAILGRITKLIVAHNSYFVNDDVLVKSLKRFALDGSYIATIGSRGEGPKEYLEPTDFTIQDSLVLVYDAVRDNILYYNIDGEFIKSQKTKFFFREFCALGSKYFCCYNIRKNPHIESTDNYNLIITDTSYNIKHLALYNRVGVPYHVATFSMNNDKIYYSRYRSDTIYSIDNESNIRAEYTLKFDKPILPLSIHNSKNLNNINKAISGNQYITTSNYLVLNDYVFTEYVNDGKLYYSFYSKKNRKNKYYDYSTTKFDNAPLGLGRILTGNNNKIISFFLPCELGNLEDRKQRMVNHKLLQSIDSVKEDDNPILVVSHVREF